MTKERIGLLAKTALETIKDNGGSLPSREVITEVEKRIKLTEEEKAPYEKSGYIRWQSILHFYSIDLIKAGWLVKKGGVWYITPEGVQSLKYQPLEFITLAGQAYRDWKRKARQKAVQAGIPFSRDAEIEEASERVQVADYEQAQDSARKRISDFITDLDPYEFQDLVAALLRGMGYYTSFVAPKGKDGGIDIIAYRDPLGVQSPRIKAQVKHRQEIKATIQEIKQLLGNLGDEHVGLFVSSAGFTQDAVEAVRSSVKHMETIDLDRLIDLWIEHYDKLTEEDKVRLPLRPIYYLAPKE